MKRMAKLGRPPVVRMALCAMIMLVSPAAVGQPAGVATISVKEIAKLIDKANSAGTRLKGYGLTVFEGTEPERFEVEFRSVLWNLEGKNHYLLVKLSDRKDRKEKILQKATIVAGMSGSPVYIEQGGKPVLVGAVSFGYPGAKEAIGGVTPIEYMTRIFDRPVEKPERLWAAAPMELAGGAQRIRTPLYVSGFTRKAMERVRSDFKGTDVVPMSGGAAGEWNKKLQDVQLKPGSAVGLQLATGDFEWAASGTVTWVQGSKVLIFGHQFERMGEAAYPLTTAYVQGTIPINDVSFKLAAPIKQVGSTSQDRSTGVAGLLDRRAKMFPVKYTVRNVKRQKLEGRKVEDVYNVRIVDDGLFGPYLMRAIFYNLLTLAEPGAKDNTVFVKTKIKFKGHDPIEISDAYYSFGDAYNGGIFAAVQAVLYNPMKRVELESMEVDVSIDHDFKMAAIKRVETAAQKAKPGDVIDVDVLMTSYNREDFVIKIKVPIPRDVKPGVHAISIYGGGSAGWITDFRVMFGDGVRSVEDILALYKERVRGDAIVAEMSYPTYAVRVKGTLYPNLPDTVAATLLDNEDLQAAPAEQIARHLTVVEWAVYGGQTLTIEIEE